MSRRSRKHRKRFGCGHRGFGRYCHCCAEAEAVRRSRKQVKQTQQQRRRARCLAWQATFAADPIDLRQLPRPIVLKARAVLSALQAEAGYWQLSGKRLNAAREIVSIPVTRRYRLLCKFDGRSLTPLTVLTHEDYNSLVQAHRHFRHWQAGVF